MKKKTIGLPRVFLYYKYNTLWRKFFKYLGCSIYVSPSTNEEIKDNAIIFNIDTDYNSKIYLGHIFYLFNRCDYVLVENNNIYQDIIRILPNISILCYKNYNNILLEFYSLFKIGLKITKNIFKIVYAYVKAKIKESKVKSNILKNQNNLLYNENKKILIVSLYNSIYGKYIDDSSYEFLFNHNINLIYAHILDKKLSISYAKHIKDYIYNKKLTGAIFYYQNAIDGIIFLGNNEKEETIKTFLNKYQINKKYLVINEDNMYMQITKFVTDDIL